MQKLNGGKKKSARKQACWLHLYSQKARQSVGCSYKCVLKPQGYKQGLNLKQFVLFLKLFWSKERH